MKKIGYQVRGAKERGGFMSEQKQQEMLIEPKANLRVEVMIEDIFLYIKKYDYVSFPELLRRYGEQAKGDWTLSTDAPSILYYAGMSEKFTSCIAQLLKSKRIHPHPASTLVYIVDGGVLTFPIARNPPQNGYKTTHWIPVTFRIGAKCDLKECPINQIKKRGHGGSIKK